MGDRDALAGARSEIEAIDAGLLDLLNRRARIVADLHAWKRAAGVPVFDGARTDAILERMERLNGGPLRAEQVRTLFTFLLHHYALEHRPAASTAGGADVGRFAAPFLVTGPASVDGVGEAARLLARHGVRCLRVPHDAPACGLAAARRACDAARLLLWATVRAGEDPGEAAGHCDVLETAGPLPDAALRALARRDGAIAVATGGDGERALATARAAGVRVLVTCRPGEPVPIGRDGDAVLADLCGAAPGERTGLVLGALAAGRAGAVFDPGGGEEALADLAYRAVRLCLALAPWPGAASPGAEG